MKCRSSQELIFAQIPWAYAGAERSRLARGRPEHNKSQIFAPEDKSFPNVASISPGVDDTPVELTTEEKLLAALLAANEELLEALRVYVDLESLAIERRTEERSRKDVRMDRSVSLGLTPVRFFLTLVRRIFPLTMMKLPLLLNHPRLILEAVRRREAHHHHH